MLSRVKGMISRFSGLGLAIDSKGLESVNFCSTAQLQKADSAA